MLFLNGHDFKPLVVPFRVHAKEIIRAVTQKLRSCYTKMCNFGEKINPKCLAKVYGIFDRWLYGMNVYAASSVKKKSMRYLWKWKKQIPDQSVPFSIPLLKQSSILKHVKRD